MKSLTATEATDYSLWKVTKKIKTLQQPIIPIRLPNGKWTRSNKKKVKLFAEYLERVFTPSLQQITDKEEEETPSFANISTNGNAN